VTKTNRTTEESVKHWWPGYWQGWPDRLRLLLTGKLRLSSIVACETPDVGVTKSRLDWRIVAPGLHDD
jgi:hypothetical protein